jgi:hypothetical protein
MKKQLLLTTVMFIHVISALRSQIITNTYSTGFDNAAEQAGWTQYKTGVQTGFSDYDIVPNDAYSAPNCLYHPYPVGGSEETIDWYVSPVFDFSAGGKIDSLRCAFSGFGNPATDDTVAIVLLKGSQNPALATSKVLLYDFRGADYANDDTWRRFTNINIPATSGQSYLAFKYRTVINWLDIHFDNLTVRSSHTGTFTALAEQSNTEQILLFPNFVEKNGPVTIRQNASQEEKIQVKLFNILGALVYEKAIDEQENSFIIDQPAGTYIYQITRQNGTVLKAGKLIVQ